MTAEERRWLPSRRTFRVVAAVILAASCTPTNSITQDGPVVTVFGGYRGVEAQRFADSIIA